MASLLLDYRMHINQFIFLCLSSIHCQLLAFRGSDILFKLFLNTLVP